MKIGGWRTRSVFERYAIVDQNDIAAAMKKLQASEEKAENSDCSVTVERKSGSGSVLTHYRKSVAVAKAQIVN